MKLNEKLVGNYNAPLNNVNCGGYCKIGIILLLWYDICNSIV